MMRLAGENMFGMSHFLRVEVMREGMDVAGVMRQPPPLVYVLFQKRSTAPSVPARLPCTDSSITVPEEPLALKSYMRE